MRCVVLSVLIQSGICFMAAPRGATTRNTSLLAVDPAAASEEAAADVQRRNVLSSLLVVGSAAGITSGGFSDVLYSINSADSSSLGSSALLTVNDAVDLIESSCDRRFLHAVVASDYRLMYRSEPNSSSKGKIMTITEPPMNLLETSDADVWKLLEEQLADRPIQPSNSRLATSVAPDAEMGSSNMVSVWPLGDNVHYAWPEEGHTFRDNISNNRVIVDGVDCGRMSLEDALESEKDILFRSQSYLVVPPSMEKELITKLKGAFLI